MIYIDVVFAPYLITGVDFLIPSPTPLIPWNGFYTAWSEYSLGFPHGIGWTKYGALLNGFFALISIYNIILAQKFMFMGVFFASIFMYVFLIAHITKLKLIAFMGALLYAYGPSTVNYGTGIVWELAFFPLVIYFIFNILSTKSRLRDAAFMALSLDFMTGYGLHIFIFLPIIFIIFLLLNLHEIADKIDYLKNTLKVTTIGLTLFLLSNTPLLLTIISFLPFSYLLPAQEQVATLASGVSITQFYWNYSPISLSGWFTESYALVRSIVPSLGYLFPILAFLALIISKSKKSRKLSLGFSSLFLIMFLFIIMVVQRSNLFIWLYNNFPPIGLLRGLECVLFLTSFVITTLIVLTVHELIENIEFKGDWRLKKKEVSVAFVLLLLVCSFIYVPAFLPEEHINGQGYSYSPNNNPVEVPIIYNLIVNWMEEKGDAGSFRYLLLPSPLSSSIVWSNWYPHQFAPVHGLPLTNQYVYYSLSALLSKRIDQWGRLLAPAGVKYIFVIWNTTEPNLGGGSGTWIVKGEPSIQTYSRPCGSYQHYIELLSMQKDLKLIINASNYLIYENLDYLPNISIFSSLAYVIGDLNVINTLAKYPTFLINETLLTFFEQNKLETLNYATSAIFYNRDIHDLLLNNIMGEYTLSLINLGSSERIMIGTSWVQATAEQNYISEQGIPTSGLLITEGNFIETTGDSEAITSFSVQNDGEYQIWLCSMYAPVSTGYLNFLIDGHTVNVSIQTSSQIFEGFEWTDLGSFILNRGTHTLKIRNSDGYGAISKLAFVPKIIMEKAIINLSQVLETKQLIFIFNNASHNVETTRVKEECVMSTTVNLPITTDYILGCFPAVSISDSILVVDNVVFPFQLLSNNWLKSPIIRLSKGNHNITIKSPYLQSTEYLSISTENSKNMTEYLPPYNVINVGNSEYIIKLQKNIKHKFIMLSEAYSDEWIAYADGGELPHFIAYSFLNGYYLNDTEFVNIKYDGQRYLTIIWISLLVFSVTVLIGSVDYYLEKKNTKRET